MFDRTLAALLQSLTQEYVVTRASDVTVGITGGHLVLDNAELRADSINKKLQNANIPFQILTARTGRLRVHVPWAALTSAPIKLYLENVELHATLDTGDSGKLYRDSDSASRDKQPGLDRIDDTGTRRTKSSRYRSSSDLSLKASTQNKNRKRPESESDSEGERSAEVEGDEESKLKGEDGSEESSSSILGWHRSLLGRLLFNVELEVNGIKVEYADSHCRGWVSASSVIALSMDESWQPSFVQLDSAAQDVHAMVLRKLVQFRGLNVVFVPREMSPEQVEARTEDDVVVSLMNSFEAERPILNGLGIAVKVEMCASGELCQREALATVVDVELEEPDVAVSARQLRWISEILRLYRRTSASTESPLSHDAKRRSGSDSYRVQGEVLLASRVNGVESADAVDKGTEKARALRVEKEGAEESENEYIEERLESREEEFSDESHDEFDEGEEEELSGIGAEDEEDDDGYESEEVSGEYEEEIERSSVEGSSRVGSEDDVLRSGSEEEYAESEEGYRDSDGESSREDEGDSGSESADEAESVSESIEETEDKVERGRTESGPGADRSGGREEEIHGVGEAELVAEDEPVLRKVEEQQQQQRTQNSQLSKQEGGWRGGWGVIGEIWSLITGDTRAELEDDASELLGFERVHMVNEEERASRAVEQAARAGGATVVVRLRTPDFQVRGKVEQLTEELAREREARARYSDVETIVEVANARVRELEAEVSKLRQRNGDLVTELSDLERLVGEASRNKDVMIRQMEAALAKAERNLMSLLQRTGAAPPDGNAISALSMSSPDLQRLANISRPGSFERVAAAAALPPTSNVRAAPFVHPPRTKRRNNDLSNVSTSAADKLTLV
mmetsp:Transcript_17140/g.37297  ORF Transcript_17140/g.37297 Transcript_17140/m.37297 type:complete len:855 (+) Transcript_17140:119-2683(+)